PPRDRARSASAEDSGAHQGVDRQGRRPRDLAGSFPSRPCARPPCGSWCGAQRLRSEEHTSELQSLTNLVCRLLLEKKKVPHPHEARHKVDSGAKTNAFIMILLGTLQNGIADQHARLDLDCSSAENTTNKSTTSTSS